MYEVEKEEYSYICIYKLFIAEGINIFTDEVMYNMSVYTELQP